MTISADRRDSRTNQVNKTLWVLFWGVVFLALSSWIATQTGLAWWQPVTCDQSLKIHAYRAAPSGYNVVVMGSSRAELGVNPLVVEKELSRQAEGSLTCFNLSQSAGQIRTDHVIFREVLRGQSTPDVVVLCTEARGFNSMSRRTSEYVKHYAQPWDILVEIRDIAAAGCLSDAASSFIRSISCVVQYLTQSPRTQKSKNHVLFWELSKGHGDPFRMNEGDQSKPAPTPGSRRWKAKFEKRKSFVRDNLLNDFEIGRASRRAFEKIIEISRERKIELVVVNMPLTTDYMSLFEPGEYSQYMSYITKTCDREKIPFFDYNAYEQHLPDSLFYDPDHLGPKGSILFSRRIARDALKPIFRNAQ